MKQREDLILGRFSFKGVLMAAGIAIVAPYLIRRLLPLFQGDAADVSANDIALAGKDSIRDVADDLGVGGVSGTISRGVDRVADRLAH